MRILAIGDIHGCLTALDKLLEIVQPQADDQLIFLGDYVDRGPDSRGVIDRVLSLRATHRLVCLRGNHDVMMLKARDEPAERRAWLYYGGHATLQSYGKDGLPASFDEVPAAHWDFLQGTALFHETETHFFVHANVDPQRALADQPEYALMWQKLVAPEPHISGKIMVCGHTAQKIGLPLNFGHAICIDTYVYADGWLTCLDVISGKVWQANERGESRELALGDASTRETEE
jgi:serine/threonine protein phosphatase 1